MMTYTEFKVGPPRRVVAGIGTPYLELLDMMPTYSMFKKGIIAREENDPGSFAKNALRYARVCNPWERELLKAILLLTGFPHVADKIAAGQPYGNAIRCGEAFRSAIAACVFHAGDDVGAGSFSMARVDRNEGHDQEPLSDPNNPL